MKKLIAMIYAVILVLGLIGCKNQTLQQDEGEITDDVPTVSQKKDPEDPLEHIKVICGEEIRYNADGKIMHIYEEVYDEKTNTIIERYYDGNRNLQSSTEHQYDLSGKLIRYEKNQGGRGPKTLYQYDENGNQTQIIECDSDGKVQRVDSYEYDRNGNQISHDVYNGYSDTTTKSEYVCDDHGNITKIRQFDADGKQTGTLKYTYNANGNQVSCVKYDAQGRKGETTIYKYDANNNMTCITHYDADGKVTRKIEYEYDAQGNMLCHILSDQIDGVTDVFRFEYAYDDNGNQISYREYRSNEQYDRCEYTYDEKGNRIKSERYYEDDIIDYTTKMEYDDNGNKIREEEYDADGVLSCKIEYRGYRTVDLASQTQTALQEELEIIEPPSDTDPTEMQTEPVEPPTINQSEMQEDTSAPLFCTRTTRTYSDFEKSEINEEFYDENGNMVLYKFCLPSDNYIAITETEYNQNGQPIREIHDSFYEYYTTLWEYDENNNEIRNMEQFSDGTIQVLSSKSYDQNGNLIRDEYYDDEGKIKTIDEYKYHYNGQKYKKLSCVSYNADGDITYSAEYLYDDTFTYLQSIRYSHDNELSSITDYEYSEDGNHTKISYNPDGSIDYTVEFNRHSDPLRLTEYNSDRTISRQTIYEYDENRNLLSQCRYVDNQVDECHEYQYDQNGNETQYKYYSEGGVLEYATEQDYDEAGRIISSIKYDPSGNITRKYEYTYYQTTEQAAMANKYTLVQLPVDP